MCAAALSADRRRSFWLLTLATLATAAVTAPEPEPTYSDEFPKRTVPSNRTRSKSANEPNNKNNNHCRTPNVFRIQIKIKNQTQTHSRSMSAIYSSVLLCAMDASISHVYNEIDILKTFSFVRREMRVKVLVMILARQSLFGEKRVAERLFHSSVGGAQVAQSFEYV